MICRRLQLKVTQIHKIYYREQRKMTMAATQNLEPHILTLPQGQIKGVQRQTLYDEPYFSFEGIPYAKPPLGELRFRAPQAPEPWTGIRDCTEFSDMPTQKNIRSGQVEGSEDCLYLNVYTKTLTSDKPLPVMVWIYGGAFQTGRASREHHGPDYLLEEKVVLVTFNYRLDSLGFISFCDPSLQAPGNAGLKDQVLALKWVKQYIAHFNGDSDNITVFGESAGGVSAHYMMATEQTRDLFHKAIVMSGCLLNYWADMPHNDRPYRLAKQHGYEGENNEKMVFAYLQKLEPQQLVNHNLLTEEERHDGFWFSFSPTVEPYVCEDCVVPQAPLEMLKTAWSNRIPMMLGGTSLEGLVMYPSLKMFPKVMHSLRINPEFVLPFEVRETFNVEQTKEMSSKLIKLYFGEKEPNEEAILNYVQLYTDKVFWHGVYRTALARLAYSSAPTYLYRFDFDSPTFNFHRKRFVGQDPVRGVAHADDMSYMFKLIESYKLEKDTAEFKTIQRMVGMWTCFARKSDPNCDKIKPATWEPLKPSQPIKAMNISYELEFVELPEKPKLDVWDSLYTKAALY